MLTKIAAMGASCQTPTWQMHKGGAPAHARRENPQGRASAARPGLHGTGRLLRISSRKQVPSFGNLGDRIGRKIHSSSIQLSRVRRALRTPRFDSRSCRVDLLSPQNLGFGWKSVMSTLLPGSEGEEGRSKNSMRMIDKRKMRAVMDMHIPIIRISPPKRELLNRGVTDKRQHGENRLHPT